MIRRRLLVLSFLLASIAPALLLGAGLGRAEDRGEGQNQRPIRLLTTIAIPGTATNPSGKMYVFDISWLDARTQLYYLADRSNAVIDVIDAKKNVFVKQIPGKFTGFTGNNNTSGPDGVVSAGRWLFVTDAPSRVVSIDLRTDQIVSDVSTGGADKLRSDELAFDPQHGLILAVNNADTPPFATLIKVDKQTGKLTVGPKISFPTATNGAEQPVWDRRTGRFYLSIPEVNGDGGTGTHGAVARINPTTDPPTVELLQVDLCQPAGLTLGPRNDLLLGCSVIFDTAGAAWSASDTKAAAPTQIIMDADSGQIDATVQGVGGSDEVWFNSGDGHYYTASRANPLGPVLGVIDAERRTLIQLVPTINVAAGTAPNPVHPAGTAHSVAVNPNNNHIFVPLPANNAFPNCLTGCIAVYGTSKEDDN